MVKHLLDLIVKPEVVEGKNGKQLKVIDLSNKDNLFKLSNINLGFAVEEVIKNFKKY